MHKGVEDYEASTESRDILVSQWPLLQCRKICASRWHQLHLIVDVRVGSDWGFSTRGGSILVLNCVCRQYTPSVHSAGRWSLFLGQCSDCCFRFFTIWAAPKFEEACVFFREACIVWLADREPSSHAWRILMLTSCLARKASTLPSLPPLIPMLCSNASSALTL